MQDFVGSEIAEWIREHGAPHDSAFSNVPPVNARGHRSGTMLKETLPVYHLEKLYSTSRKRQVRAAMFQSFFSE